MHAWTVEGALPLKRFDISQNESVAAWTLRSEVCKRHTLCVRAVPKRPQQKSQECVRRGIESGGRVIPSRVGVYLARRELARSQPLVGHILGAADAAEVDLARVARVDLEVRSESVILAAEERVRLDVLLVLRSEGQNHALSPATAAAADRVRARVASANVP